MERLFISYYFGGDYIELLQRLNYLRTLKIVHGVTCLFGGEILYPG